MYPCYSGMWHMVLCITNYFYFSSSHSLYSYLEPGIFLWCILFAAATTEFPLGDHQSFISSGNHLTLDETEYASFNSLWDTWHPGWKWTRTRRLLTSQVTCSLYCQPLMLMVLVAQVIYFYFLWNSNLPFGYLSSACSAEPCNWSGAETAYPPPSLTFKLGYITGTVFRTLSFPLVPLNLRLPSKWTHRALKLA